MINRYSTTSVITTFLKYFILVFFAFWTLVPLFSCFITAFKSAEEYGSTSVMMFPQKWDFKNFIKAAIYAIII